MPFLDVSELLTDPDFCEEFQIVRGKQTIDNHGHAVNTETTIQATGVITAGSPDRSILTMEAQAAQNSIAVHCQTPLYSIATGFTADKILWNGDLYKVIKTWDWSKFGKGFNVAECELIPLTETP